jgi:hypothetical protein
VSAEKTKLMKLDITYIKDSVTSQAMILIARRGVNRS